MAEQSQWDATNAANKDRLLGVIRREAEGMFALATPPENWEAPTASGHWQVRDIIGHMVDVTEGYLKAFETARAGGEPVPALGLRVMAQTLDEHAQAFRSISQSELLRRLRGDFDQMMTVFAGLTAEEWTGFMVGHTYLGPIPAFVFPTFHLVDYAVHSWDIREGLRLPNGLSGDAADFLAPIMFVLWQGVTATERLGGESIAVGVRVSGRNAGTWRVNVTESGLAYEPGPVDDLPVVFDFDPASLILTAYDRIRGGTSYGDQALANRYRNLFFTI